MSTVASKDEGDTFVAGMIAAGAFKEGDRPHLLLRHLIDEELAGRGERLKAYSIAMDVFRRREDFNPAVDSVVRVEMLRLRRAVKAYSLGAPPLSVVVDFDKGSYRPKFYRTAAAEERRPSGLMRLLPYMLWGIGALVGVAALFVLHSPPVDERCSWPTLSIQVVGVPAQEDAMLTARARSIIGAYQTVQVTDDGNLCNNSLANRLSLRIDRRESTIFTANLTSGADDAQVWSHTDVLPPEADADVVIVALARILYALASGDGVIMVQALKADWPSQKDRLDMDCLRTAEAYLSRVNSVTHDDAVSCLQRAIDEKTTHSWFYGAYAQTLQLPFLRERKPLPPEVNANYQHAVERALQIDPLDTKALTARLREYRRAVPPELDELHRLTKLIVGHLWEHPTMLYQAAMVDGFYLGRWNEASDLITRAAEIGGYDPDYQYVVTAAHIVNSNWEAARDRLNVRQDAVNPLEGVLMVAVGSRLNDHGLISKGREILSERGYDDIVNIKEYLDNLWYEVVISEKLYFWCKKYYETLV